MTSIGNSDPLDHLERMLASRFAWILLGIAVLLSFVGDVRNTYLYGGVDLRNRVIGARLMAEGINPYTYFWQAGDPEGFFDVQAQPGRPANRITVTPAILASHMLMSGWRFRTVQWIWLAVQWICLAATVALLVYAAPVGRRRLVLAALLAMCVCGEVWRMHVERGHVYIVYALLWAGAYAFSQRRNGGEWGCGIMLGFCAVLRPTCILVALPFLISRRWRVMAGGVVGATACLAATWPFANVETWRSYLSHMDDIGQYYLQPETIPSRWRYPDAILATVEGDAHPDRYRDFGASGTALQLYLTRLLPGSLRDASLKLAFLAFVAVYMWRLNRVWRTARSLMTGLMAGMVLSISADFFIPVSRTMYNDILWAVPMCILLSHEQCGSLLRAGWGLAFAIALVLANDVLSVAQYDMLRCCDFLLLGLMVVMSLRMAKAEATEATMP